jgi:hypothetical protein
MGQIQENSNHSKKKLKNLKTHSNNEGGFLVANLIIFIPLLLGGILFIYLLSSHIEVQAHIYDICRSDLQTTQSTVQKELQALMTLNPIVRILKIAAMAIQWSLLFSVLTPPIFTALVNALHKIRTIQKAIAKMQKLLITLMTQTMRVGISLIKLKILKELLAYKFKLNTLVNLNFFEVTVTNKPKPAIEPTNKNERPSEYKLSENFERTQKLEIKWSFISEITTKFKKYALLNRSFTGKCSFSLSEEGSWAPIQIAVR